MAGDSHEVALYKRWITKENALAQSMQRGEVPFTQRQPLNGYMSSHFLSPSPQWAEASSHLRGRPRQDWARYVGGMKLAHVPGVLREGGTG